MKFKQPTIVLRLFGNRSNKIVFIGDQDGLGDLRSRPLACTPVIRHVEIPNDLGKAFHDFSHGRADIWTVCQDNVDVRLLEALQTRFEAFDDMFAAEAARVGLLSTCAEEDLCAQDIFVAWPSKFLERLAHLELGLPIGINLGRVEEVDALIPGCLQAFLDYVTLDGPSVGKPPAQRQDGDLETTRTQMPKDLFVE